MQTILACDAGLSGVARTSCRLPGHSPGGVCLHLLDQFPEMNALFHPETPSRGGFNLIALPDGTERKWSIDCEGSNPRLESLFLLHHKYELCLINMMRYHTISTVPGARTHGTIITALELSTVSTAALPNCPSPGLRTTGHGTRYE